MVVVEGRVIPADRRGSCCFLLGIVTVTFHGASHAGITRQSSLSVWKNHPVSRGRSFDLGAGKVCQTGFSLLNLIAGSASTVSTKIRKRFGQLLTPSWPSKIIFLHFSHGRKKAAAAKKKHLETQVFSSLLLEKNPP